MMTRWGEEPISLGWTSAYVRRLLIERFAIRAALLGGGGSVVLTSIAARTDSGYSSFSSSIGNSFHLDLLQLEQELKDLPKGQRDALYTYIDGLSASEAAMYLGAKGTVSFRKRRSRAILELTERLQNAEQDQRVLEKMATEILALDAKKQHISLAKEGILSEQRLYTIRRRELTNML